MKVLSNEQILNKLQSVVEEECDQALSYLYRKTYPVVQRFILRNQGGEDDAADIFQDGLIALYKLARRDKLSAQTNMEAYLYSICRNMWVKSLKNRPLNVELNEEIQAIPTETVRIQTLLSQERDQILDQVLQQLGRDCYQLLLYFYYDRLRMKEIVVKMNFSNEQVAKNKKSKCMRKLRTIIEESPAYKNMLK